MTGTQRHYAIIVAGGSGSRMNTKMPKQFLLLHNKPVLYHVLEKFFQAGIEMVVVLPAAYHSYWEELKLKYPLSIPHRITLGGNTRSESVYNGLMCIPHQNSLTGVHDAARALVSVNLIQRLYEFAADAGNAVPVVSLQDSIRKVNGEQNCAANRDDYKIVQTPQVFRTDQLLKAFQTTSTRSFNDEASLMESCGYPINLVKGETQNFKITYEHDLEIAALLLK